MAVPTYTKTGTKATTPVKLNKDVFGVAPKNHDLLKQAYVAYLANGRINLAVTKTRGLVSGGGKKPWKQKGTGRARFGSSRNPIWRGGGIAFGPTGLENYTHKLPTATKRLAIRQALSVSNDSNKVIVLEDIAFSGKTTDAVKLFAKIGATKTILVVVDTKTDQAVRAVSNLTNVKLITAKYLNVYDIINADSVVISKKALDIVSEWLVEAPAKVAETKGGKA